MANEMNLEPKANEAYLAASVEHLKADIEEERKNTLRARIACFVTAAIGIGVAVYCGKKLKDVCGVVGSAVTDVSNLTYIDVQQAVVDKAVEKATAAAAKKAVESTYAEMASQVSTAVTSAVQSSKSAIKQAVTERIAKEAAAIDRSEVFEEAAERAKELVLKKFETRLDGIAADYSRNLENMGKIYSGIAETMAKSTAK